MDAVDVLLTHGLAGSFAAVVSTVTCFPIDLVKVQISVHGKVKIPEGKAFSIKFWFAGCEWAAFESAVFNLLNFGLYELLRFWWAQMYHLKALQAGNTPVMPPLTAIAVGIFSAGATQLVSNPIEVMKTTIQVRTTPRANRLANLCLCRATVVRGHRCRF